MRAPSSADDLVLKAKNLLRRRRLEPLAFRLYEEAIAQEPARIDTRLACAKSCWGIGASEKARSICESVLSQWPDAAEARLLRAVFHFPFLYRNGEEVRVSRAAYSTQLGDLAADAAHDPDVAKRLACWADRIYPYYLPYQGNNDVELQRTFGGMMCRAVATAHPEWTRSVSLQPPIPGEKLRIGIVSQHFYSHSNWRAIIAGWMRGLDPSRFAVHAYYSGIRQDEATETARGLAARFTGGEKATEHWSFEDWCRVISADRLHVLLYPAIGTHSLVTKLAMVRLAPIQCVAAGHCTTTGFPSMDYFLSAELTEPPDAAAHYSETLVRLPGLGIRYMRPSVTAAVRTRESFGLRPSACVFLSPNSIVKYLPEHDAIYARIAASVTDCQIVFVRHARLDAINRQFEERMRSSFEAVGVDWDRHVLFLPRLSRRDYNDLQTHSDVYLDSIGWNGGATTSIAAGYGLPIVTLTGPVFRGRMGTAMLRLMGIEETIAKTPEEYIQIAVRLGHDEELRHSLRSRIAQGRDPLYDDDAVPAALASFLEKAVAEKAKAENKQTLAGHGGS